MVQWRIIASSKNSKSPWSCHFSFEWRDKDDFCLLSAGYLEKTVANRTRLLALPLISYDASWTQECPANEYFIVTTFILLCLLKYLKMACDIWEFLFWETQLSDQQSSSVTFGWSAAILFRICIKALAMSFPARPYIHSVQITWTLSKLHNNLALKMSLPLDYRVWAFFCRRVIQYRLLVELSHFQGQILPINSSRWWSIYLFFSSCIASISALCRSWRFFSSMLIDIAWLFLILISSHFSHRSVFGMWKSIL